MKFNPGDPVWARHRGDYAPRGEYAAIVLGPGDPRGPWEYTIDVLDYPCPLSNGGGAQEEDLRPRRDDYQQHEPRTTMRDVRDSLRDNLPLRETVNES